MLLLTKRQNRASAGGRSGMPAAQRLPAFAQERCVLQIVPNHRQRQLMQRLRGRDWVRAFEISEGPRTLHVLLERRWIEQRGVGPDMAYRITDEGMAAKTAPIQQI